MYIEQDKLNRIAFVDTLEKIIEKKFSEQDGFSFAIDGKWGCGKTFIVNMLEERLKNKYLVIKYNCWKYDYHDEPVVAIMSVIADTLNKIAAEEAPPTFVNQDTFKNIAKFLIGTGAKLFEAATNIDLKGILEQGKEIINNEYKDKISRDFDSKDSLTKAIEIIHMALCLAHSDKKVLFIVDELDRCLPEYAIKVLERLHHINEGTQFITMLSINKNGLAGSIAKVFGKNESNTNFAEYYLQKFTNIIISIPKGKTAKTILDKFKLSKNNFDIDSNNLFINNFEKFFSNVIGTLPIRTIETIDKQINALNALIRHQNEQPTKIAFCVATLKIFEKIIAKSQIKTTRNGNTFFLQIRPNNTEFESYNGTAFNHALSQWSGSTCNHFNDFMGNFRGFRNSSTNFQDYVKFFFNQTEVQIDLAPPLPPQDLNYLSEFDSWLNLFS